MKIDKTVIQERDSIFQSMKGKAPEICGKDCELANRIYQGIVPFDDNESADVGLKNIDWTGAHIKHQEWFHKPAPLVEYSYSSLSPAISATLIMPSEQELRPLKIIAREMSFDTHLHYLSFQTPSGHTDHIAWSVFMDKAIEGIGPVQSDSPLIWWRTDETGQKLEDYHYKGSLVDFI